MLKFGGCAGGAREGETNFRIDLPSRVFQRLFGASSLFETVGLAAQHRNEQTRKPYALRFVAPPRSSGIMPLTKGLDAHILVSTTRATQSES